MKRKVFLSTAIAVLAAIIMVSCASMTVVGIDESSVEGPKQVRQYGTISPGDITVYAEYKDGSSKKANVSAGNITFDSSKAGPQTVTVTVSGFRASFTTEVMPLTGISVVTQNAAWRLGTQVRVPRTAGGQGGALAAPGNDRNNWPGLEIQAEWQGMGSEKLSDRDISDDCVFSEFNTGTVGRYDVTVTWRDMQTTFPVNVVALQSIRIDRPPNKTTYVQGESFSNTGLRVMGTWPGLSDMEVNGSVGGYDANKLGKQTLTVTYQGKSASFEVEVAEKPVEAAPIVGKWFEKKDTYEFFFIFNADGTFETGGALIGSGKYSVSGSILTLTARSSDAKDTFSVSGNELTLTGFNAITGSNYTQTRTRKAGTTGTGIVGTWDSNVWSEFTFTSNGRWEEVSSSGRREGVYEISGNELTRYNESVSVLTFTLSGNTLTLTNENGTNTMTRQ